MSVVTCMPHFIFDTLAYANKLKAAGLDPRIAEAQAELQATVLSELTTNQLASKKDLQELKLELQLDISKLKNELIIKLGGIVVACTAILGTLVAIFARMH